MPQDDEPYALEPEEPQEVKPRAPAPKPVRADQANLFNEQGALFSHVRQPGEMEP